MLSGSVSGILANLAAGRVPIPRKKFDATVCQEDNMLVYRRQ
jgi:hypothetical protein